MIYPVDNTVAHFSSSFGMRNGRQHTGIDVGGGTKAVYAALPGEITKKDENDNYGFNIKIQSGKYTTWYKHLIKFKYEKDAAVRDLKIGDSVLKSQRIGTSGDTGESTKEGAIHLHFEVLVDGRPVDPWIYLP
jgi:murein DD-endopeptidase MepM/ murein hydrolase activator NlpD